VQVSTACCCSQSEGCPYTESFYKWDEVTPPQSPDIFHPWPAAATSAQEVAKEINKSR